MWYDWQHDYNPPNDKDGNMYRALYDPNKEHDQYCKTPSY